MSAPGHFERQVSILVFRQVIVLEHEVSLLVLLAFGPGTMLELMQGAVPAVLEFVRTRRTEPHVVLQGEFNAEIGVVRVALRRKQRLRSKPTQTHVAECDEVEFAVSVLPRIAEHNEGPAARYACLEQLG